MMQNIQANMMESTANTASESTLPAVPENVEIPDETSTSKPQQPTRTLPAYSPPPSRGSTSSSPCPHGVRSNRVPNRPLVYVTRRIPQKGMDILLTGCDVKQWDAEEPVPRGELLFSIACADGIFCMPGDYIGADVLDAAGPSLQVVATTAFTTGGHIDVEACEARGIQVLTCPDQPTETLADLTVTLVLLTIKETQTDEERLVNFDLLAPDLIPSKSSNNAMEILTNARTQSRPRLIQQMSEERLAFQFNNGKPGNANSSTWRNILKKRFGIYGLTRLGLSVARLLNSLGVSNVMVADRAWETDVGKVKDTITGSGSSCFKMVTFDELLRNSDVVCVCDESAEIGGEDDEDIGKTAVFCQEAFEKMNPDSILVTPHRRQPAVDYLDLYVALRDGQIRAAGLNDCNQQPVPLKAPLLGLKNCVFLPQTQESVYDMRHKVSVLMARNLTNALAAREKSHSM